MVVWVLWLGIEMQYWWEQQWKYLRVLCLLVSLKLWDSGSLFLPLLCVGVILGLSLRGMHFRLFKHSMALDPSLTAIPLF
ncbi:hypothetical protein RHMOL_Rhmol04G0328500 [Rhododendron molle]|uniref:Uncharacterized protein n=1 Tax=Rhododendron molle TaxID=49168 RepID=A0ACC0P988_RHOML|nr:hypothetical protein RHMOL_Rhmol04G0328500 [Rhododendron molle]